MGKREKIREEKRQRPWKSRKAEEMMNKQEMMRKERGSDHHCGMTRGGNELSS